jgi:hypothetical protein
MEMLWLLDSDDQAGGSSLRNGNKCIDEKQRRRIFREFEERSENREIHFRTNRSRKGYGGTVGGV